MSYPAPHPFAVWARERYGMEESPYGDFAREIAPELPSTGTHAELLRRLWNTADEWALHAFDTLWAEYQRSGGAT